MKRKWHVIRDMYRLHSFCKLVIINHQEDEIGTAK